MTGTKHRWKVLNMAETVACPDAFATLDDIAETVSLPANEDVLRERIADFDCYFASLHVQIDRRLLERAKKLRVIATPSTGLDHIDMVAAQELGVTVLSLKEETQFLDSVTSTAELAWGLLLATVRRLPAATAAANKGDWARDRFRGHQLSGKTLGVLGYGRLGRIVAEYGKAFRMRVLACDVREVRTESGVKMVDFDQLLGESDVLSIHIHLTDTNRRLINATTLAKIKPGAVLINTSRGGIIDESALVDSLKSGQLEGAGLDVIDGEWDRNLENHPLISYARQHENLVISPHIGGITWESQRMTIEFMVAKLLNYLECENETK